MCRIPPFEESASRTGQIFDFQFLIGEQTGAGGLWKMNPEAGRVFPASEEMKSWEFIPLRVTKFGSGTLNHFTRKNANKKTFWKGIFLFTRVTWLLQFQ